MTEKNKWIDQIIIPVVRGSIMGVISWTAAHFVFNSDVALAIGFAAAGLDVLVEFERRTPKEYKQPIFNRFTNRPAPIGNTYNQVFEISKEHKVKYWHEDPNKWSRLFESSIRTEILARIGWHITYLEGRISHPYLDTKWKILTRPGIETLQNEIMGNNWGKFRGEDGKGGMLLDDECISFFRSIGREYKQKTKEEIDAFNKKYFGIEQNEEKKRELIRNATGRPLRTIRAVEIGL